MIVVTHGMPVGDEAFRGPGTINFLSRAEARWQADGRPKTTETSLEQADFEIGPHDRTLHAQWAVLSRAERWTCTSEVAETIIDSVLIQERAAGRVVLAMRGWLDQTYDTFQVQLEDNRALGIVGPRLVHLFGQIGAESLSPHPVTAKVERLGLDRSGLDAELRDMIDKVVRRHLPGAAMASELERAQAAGQPDSAHGSPPPTVLGRVWAAFRKRQA